MAEETAAHPHDVLAHACAARDGLDADTRREVRRHLLDWTGLVAGGRAHAASSPSVLGTIERLAGQAVPDGLPTGRRLDADRASLLLGTFAHSLDYDDTHLASSLHPGAPVISAALPIAHRTEADADDLLEAIALGYDVTCAVGRAVDPDAHYDRGFHVTATCGGFGAAAAVGSLLAFDAGAFERAFGVAGSQAAGSLQFLENGAWNKRLHPGLAARRGVMAATLVDEGFRGATDPFTGEFGFLRGYTGAPHPEELDDLVVGAGVRETGMKPYPCCRYLHAAIDGLLELAGSVEVDAIETIRLDLPRPGVRLTGEPIERKRRPENFVDCQFSAPFAAALALTAGEAGLQAFLDAQGRLADPELRDLMDGVEVVSTDRTNDPFPERWSAHVIVEGAGQHERFIEQPRGEPARPLSREALVTKFEELVAGTSLAAPAESAMDATFALGDGGSLDRFVDSLQGR